MPSAPGTSPTIGLTPTMLSKRSHKFLNSKANHHIWLGTHLGALSSCPRASEAFHNFWERERVVSGTWLPARQQGTATMRW